MRREHFVYGLGYLVFALVFMTPLGVAFKREYQEKQAAKVLAEEKRAAIENEKLALEAIESMSQEYPQESETRAENEVPKIVRGAEGQARHTSTGCEVDLVENRNYWVIRGGRSPVPSNGSAGWNVTSNGIVTVPDSAATGAYTAHYITSEYCSREFDENEDGLIAHYYEFEVGTLQPLERSRND